MSASIQPEFPPVALDHPQRQAALNWLLGRINYERTAVIPYHERQLKLDRMRQLLVRLGQPDAGLKIVHVAGTKGKGSTAAMIAAVLTAAGFRTGVYSSPHLERIEERFAVDGNPCTAAELVALVERLQPVVRSMDEEAAAAGDPNGGPTYFDLTTALAMVHFAERQVDAVVLEVGLGGRLDSTNVCLPVVSVITSISRDHTKQLGDTLASIAREKAGIIKPGVPVVCGVTAAEPRTVIELVAREHGCRIIQAGRDFQYRYRPPAWLPGGQMPPRGAIDFKCEAAGETQRLEGLELTLVGEHQAANAAVALAVVAELRHQGWCISTEAMRLGLVRAVLPARVEYFPPAAAGAPTIVLDAAHNEASVRALVDTLCSWPAPARRTLLVSVSRDKDVAAIVRQLAPAFDRFIVTQYQDNPRAVKAAELAELLRETVGNRGWAAGVDGHRPGTIAQRRSALVGAPPASLGAPGTEQDVWSGRLQPPCAADVTACATPREAWDLACRSAVPGELVAITGSFFLAAEMRPLVVAHHSRSDTNRQAFL